MRFSKTLVPTFVLLLVPITALALTQSTWDFRGQVPVPWDVSGMDSPQLTPEGLHIATMQKGTFISQAPVPQSTQVMTLTVTNARPTEVVFLWRSRGEPVGTFVQMPLLIPGPVQNFRAHVSLESIPPWDPKSEQIGFVFPPGTDLLLHDIQFARWNVFEKVAEAWNGFWTFDKMTPYTINFLWGPLLTFNPIATQELFTTLPPKGRSANWFFYGVLVVAAAALIAHRVITKKRGHVMIFLLIFAGTWIVYEVRMGMELFSYAKTDYQEHLMKPVGNRTFRSYGNFSDIVDLSAPYIKDEKEFAFFGPQGQPFKAHMRYFGYPAVPVEPEEASDLNVWVVFARPDVAVDSDGRLSVGGNPLSNPGGIVSRLDETSFIFVTKSTEP